LTRESVSRYDFPLDILPLILEIEHSRKVKDVETIKYLETVKEGKVAAHKKIEALFPGAEVTKDEFTKVFVKIRFYLNE